MQTSNFASYRGDRGVSIARWTPAWYTGHTCIELAPPPALIRWWKQNQWQDEPELTFFGWYHEEVLSKLDPHQLFEELEDKVLLCYEARGIFCHRRIVAEWFEYHLGVKVGEL